MTLDRTAGGQRDLEVSALDVAIGLVRRGFRVVPVAHRSKVPTDPHTGRPLDEWNTLNIQVPDLNRYFSDKPQNVGFVCGEPSGHLVDVDLDCDEAVALGPHFLPATGLIFGRAGRAKSHWLYICSLATEKFKDTKGHHAKMLVELRSTGCQTVAPGSTHENGEPILWSPGYDQKPGIVAADVLSRQVSRLAAATILARHYPPKGSRHDFALHLAGGLIRAGWGVDDAGAFIVAVASAGGSDAPESHRAAAKTSAAKFMAGENVSGWPSLAEAIGDDPVTKVRAWLGCKATPDENMLDEAWEMPIPFDDAGQLPPFPLHALPPVIREWVLAESEATQTPPDLAACIALAVISAAVQKKFELEVGPGWREPLSTFWAIAMLPGERKSAVFRDATAPIRNWEGLETERTRSTIAAATTKRQVKEKRQAELVRKAAINDDGLAAHEAQQLAIELAEERLPVAPRIACDDTTPERLNALVYEQGGRMAVLSAEGGIFDTVAGRYNDVVNIDGLLKGHAGDELRVDRMSRAPLHVRRPAVTLGLCVQPDVIRGLAQQPTFRARGLIARFLFSLPTSRVGSRNVTPASVPVGVTARYGALILRLLSLPESRADDGEIAATVLYLTARSRAIVEGLARDLESKLAPGAELETIRDWAAKSVGAAVRLAGLLHLATDSVDSVDSVGVSSSVEIQWDLGDLHAYLLAHALAAFRLMGADPASHSARLVLNWINKDRRQTFTKRGAHVALAGTFKRAKELDAPLTLLTELGFIRVAKQAERLGAGRKKSPSFEVNPGRQNQHNRQNEPRERKPSPAATLTNHPESTDCPAAATVGHSEPRDDRAAQVDDAEWARL